MAGGSESHSQAPNSYHGWLTIPNLVSGVRILAIPYFWYVLIEEDRVGFAAALIFLIGSTDWIDGFLARRLNQVSDLGKLLDPLADRLMIASALVAGLVARVLPTVIGWPLLAREVLVGIGTLILAGRRLGKLEVRWLGKAINPPPTCRFLERCPMAIDICHQLDHPPLEDKGNGHFVACHLVEVGAA